MKILYIQGLSSSGVSGTADTLRKLLPESTVLSPDLPTDPNEALALVKYIVAEENIDIAIGTSMGGMFAQKLHGTKKILVNPSFHVSASMRKRLGINPFYSPRADGATEYEITPELCDLYEAVECGQFDNLPAEEQEITIGLFGSADTTIDCSEEFKRYYTKFYTFNGGHRLNVDIIKKVLIPLIRQFV